MSTSRDAVEDVVAIHLEALRMGPRSADECHGLCSGGGKEVSALLAVAACPGCGRLLHQRDGNPSSRINTWRLPDHTPERRSEGQP